jgi:hypothetical protein
LYWLRALQKQTGAQYLAPQQQYLQVLLLLQVLVVLLQVQQLRRAPVQKLPCLPQRLPKDWQMLTTL